MTIRAKIIQEIISKIDNIPDNQLERILSYIQKIENVTDKKKSILSFAGEWENIDQDLFSELTKDLHKKRVEESDSLQQ